MDLGEKKIERRKFPMPVPPIRIPVPVAPKEEPVLVPNWPSPVKVPEKVEADYGR